MALPYLLASLYLPSQIFQLMNARLLVATFAIALTSPAFSAGKELDGERAAAKSTCPSPEEAQKMMSVPPGYEVRCFAHEPMVVNPVAMTWDSRGRLWVVEGYEYPNGSEFKNNAFGAEAKDDQYHPVPPKCQAKDDPLEHDHDSHPKIPRDRVVILEDTDNDGVADKRTVFVEGLDMGSAILMGDGGAYVGQQPHLLHFMDTDGDDHADQWRVVLTGFGREDTHELLNSFCWGPDGWLYMTHGVFTNSRVRRPGAPLEKGFKFDAGMGRCRPQGDGTLLSRPKEKPERDKSVAAPWVGDERDKSVAAPWEFEVFADGTSNPWGCDYDARGNFFVSACVIDHFFHMAPGGIYVRQGGAPENPYAYELLPSIVKHKHFRAAYAGVQIYQGGVYPADTNGHAFIGNIHDNAVHEEILTPVGATFKCEPRRDFLRANNGWFRPVSTQTGPDGNLWVMDWCDKYPCYQNAKANPEGVDRERGRIWRVVHPGSAVRPGGVPVATNPPGTSERKSSPAAETDGAPRYPSRENREMDLSKLTTPELVKLLGHSNNWMRRMARRQLVERKDEKAKTLLRDVVQSSSEGHTRLEALWALHASRMLSIGVSDPTLDFCASDKDSALRLWIARLIGEPVDRIFHYGAHVILEKKRVKELTFPALESLASDSDASVRSAVAIACRQLIHGRVYDPLPLTRDNIVDHTLPREWNPPQLPYWYDVGHLNQSLLTNLYKGSKSADSEFAFHFWMALEPNLAAAPMPWLDWLAGVISAQSTPDSQDLSHTLTYKSMRRLCDTRDAKNIDLAVAFCEKIRSHDILLAHALDGLVKGQESGALKPTVNVSKPLAAWRASTNAEVLHHAQELAVLWGDAAATDELLSVIASDKAEAKERLQALQTLRKVKGDAVRAGLVKLLRTSLPQAVAVEAIRASADVGGDAFIAPLASLAASKDYGVRLAALEALSARSNWAHTMLDDIAANKISGSGFPTSVRRQLATNTDKSIRDHAFKVLGAWKESSDDIKALIAAKKKVCLEGEPDLAQGKLIFTNTCAVCHSFHGGGQKVGPDLIGSGRSNLDALLANVIDPNQIIGNGYENINVTTKDGRTVSGRMVEDTPSHVKLLAIAGAEQIVPRDQVATLVNTHQSVMPVGFGALPDDAFRNLIWYVLSPPEEGPLTAEKRKLLSQGVEGGEAAKKKSGNNSRAIDWESVSLWNPAWKVDAPDFERTPMKLAEFHGRNNVLLLHPFTKDKPCTLERKVKIEKDKLNKLTFYIAAHDQGDFELRVSVDGELVKKETIGHEGERWHKEQIDLSKFAGKEVTLRLEGAANGWSYEFSYWSDVTLE